MGPAGSGKTTVGKMLAAQLKWDFYDGDNFHSPANIEKMSRGIPLSDDDRIPWLNSIREAILQWDAQHRNVVLACSALKRSYRELLQINSNVKLVYLKGSYELLRQRLHSRKGHYAGERILASMKQITKWAEGDESAARLTTIPSIDVRKIRRRLKVLRWRRLIR